VTSRRLAVSLALTAAPFVAVALAFDLINGFPHGLTYDDAYFYAQIGYNLGERGRSTFDGFSTTSGYHLLWGGLLGLVSALFAPFTADRAAHLYAHEVLFAGLALAVARTFYRTLIERCCVIVFVVMGTLLMETVLLSGLLLILARAEVESAGTGEAPRAAAMAAAFLVPLARIDASLIVAIYVVLLSAEGQWRRSAPLGGAVAAGALTQIGLMLWIFGEPFSVSSMIKASNAAPFGAAMWASMLGPEPIALGYAVRFGLFLGLAVAGIGIGLAARRSAANRRLLYLSVGATAFSAGHVVSQMVPFWVYLPAYLVLFYALTRSDLHAPRLVLGRRAVVAGVALLGLAFGAHKVYLFAANRDVVRGAREFVEAIAAHVPPDGRIYQIDGSGFTGYFSGRSVVNGDGLVNSYGYARRLRAGTLGGYLHEQGICYIITNVASQGGVLVDAGGLRVTADDVEEVHRSRTYGSFPTTDFVLYRRRAPECAAGATTAHPTSASRAASRSSSGRAP
jgi:hypothetical protein